MLPYWASPALAGLEIRVRADILEPRSARVVRSNELELRFGRW
jgi:hypothetical protein